MNTNTPLVTWLLVINALFFVLNTYLAFDTGSTVSGVSAAISLIACVVIYPAHRRSRKP